MGTPFTVARRSASAEPTFRADGSLSALNSGPTLFSVADSQARRIGSARTATHTGKRITAHLGVGCREELAAPETSGGSTTKASQPYTGGVTGRRVETRPHLLRIGDRSGRAVLFEAARLHRGRSPHAGRRSSGHHSFRFWIR